MVSYGTAVKVQRRFAFWIRLRIWWTSISMAGPFSPPLGMMISALRLLGSTKASCMGLTLGDDAVQRAAPLLDIPQDAAEDPLVRVGVYIDLVIEQAAQLRLSQGQNALHDEDGGGLNMLHLAAAVVVSVIVHGAVDGAARFQLLQVLDEQVVVERVRVVIVQLAALCKLQRSAKGSSSWRL